MWELIQRTTSTLYFYILFSFEDSKVRLLEAHLIDYSGPDFYDENLRVILCAFMRESLKFTTVESLKTEIQTDCDFATKSLAKDVDLVSMQFHEFLAYSLFHSHPFSF